MKQRPLFGLIAEFAAPEEVLGAARESYLRGYRKMDAFTPCIVEGLAEALGMKRTWVPFFTLVCGLIGGGLGYWMQAYSAIWDYPLNVGGRPLHSWPAFVPVTFELTVLFSALGAALGMLILNGLPRLHHPVFEVRDFAERNQTSFYLLIESADRLFDLDVTAEFLRQQNPLRVLEVPV